VRLQAAQRQLEMLEGAHKQEKAQWDGWKAQVLLERVRIRGYRVMGYRVRGHRVRGYRVRGQER